MNDDTEKWHLPEPLRMDNPAVAAAAQQMHKDLQQRVVSPFARLSPEQFARIRAQSRIQHLVASLHQVDEELKIRVDPHRRVKLKEARNALAIRLAENLAVIGRFDLAAEVSPDGPQRDEYVAKVRARMEGTTRVTL